MIAVVGAGFDEGVVDDDEKKGRYIVKVEGFGLRIRLRELD